MPRLLTRAGRYSLPAVRHSDRKSPVSGGDETGFLQCRDDLVYRLGRGLLIGSYGYVVGQVVSVAELITPASQSQRPTFDSAVASRSFPPLHLRHGTRHADKEDARARST